MSPTPYSCSYVHHSLVLPTEHCRLKDAFLEAIAGMKKHLLGFTARNKLMFVGILRDGSANKMSAEMVRFPELFDYINQSINQCLLSDTPVHRSVNTIHIITMIHYYIIIIIIIVIGKKIVNTTFFKSKWLDCKIYIQQFQPASSN